MADGQRSPFGALVFAYRNKLNLTQRELAKRASNPDHPGHDSATVSERTISAIEHFVSPGTILSRPRPSTVRALAMVFGLQPGSREYDAFLLAARTTIQGSTAETGPPLFVPDGREPQLERLREVIAGAIAGDPGVVFVGAAPGTGKTSLIAHVSREAVERHPDLVVLWGECTGRSSAADAYQPVRQILGILAGDTVAAGPRQLVSPANAQRIMTRTGFGIDALVNQGEGLIHRFVGPEPLRARRDALDANSIRKLDRILEQGGTSGMEADGLNEQAYRVLVEYATGGPTILVLEDLHWADIGTGSFLFHLMRRLRDQCLPLAVLGTYRPSQLDPVDQGDQHPFYPVLHESHRHFDDPVLDLSTAVGGKQGRAFVDAVVAHSLEDPPPSLAASLFHQTAGLPLFVLGMLRWYNTTGAIREHGNGRNTLRWSPAPGMMPTEIDALFAEQVARLPHHLRTMLDAASVQGTTFSAEVLMQVLGIPRSTLIAGIDHQLARRFHMLVPGGVETIAGQSSHAYQFSHALFRDYVYHRLTDLERSHYHTLTAEAMLALYGSGQHGGASAIAFHYDQAGERRKAATAYLTAGDHAMEHSEYEQASRLFSRIGELGVRQEEPFCVAQSLVGLGNCARGKGEAPQAVRLFERALGFARLKGLKLVQANALTSMGMLDYDAGRMTDGAARLAQAIEMLLDLGNLQEASRSLSFRALMLHGLGNYDEAAQTARRAIDLATTLDNDMLLANGMNALANCSLDLGLYTDAITMLTSCLSICEDHGNVQRASVCRLNMALCELERQRLQEAVAGVARVLEDRRRITRRLTGAAEFMAGLCAEEQGNSAEARDRYQSSLDIRTEIGQSALIIDSLAGLLRIATIEHDRDRMEDLIVAIRDRVRNTGLEGVEHTSRLYLTMIATYQELGDPACVRYYVERGLAFVRNRADRLADPGHRDSYLANVPSNVAILDAARELGVLDT
jgi:tetratricopeptide (TPR) repeat protein/transcriptional regulator with XRE-family HTH domain